ncbi:hypothetical protein KUW17_05480 [Leisingera aquaemixtae]|uniref:hypothetical protein n=1 Tax=Leisingera aquaemixtae TaxID=1396826 RepID=UPI001C95B2F4|nr:hypothetical protein [Leisingera aquaemixtae]
MTRIHRPQPHRRFIALIVAAAIAVTGFSAAPARADEDFAKVLGGLALLGIIGAAIKHSRDDDDRHVSRKYTPPAHNHSHGGHKYYGSDRHDGYVRPLPPRVRRYDLPSQCLRYFPAYSRSHALVGKGCLERSYGYTHALPKSCKVTFWNGKRHRTGYKPGCLNSHGYRLVRR